MQNRAERILLLVVVAVLALVSWSGRKGTVEPNAAGKCVALVQAGEGRDESTPPVITQEKGSPVCTREDFHPDPPHISEFLPHFEEYEILASPTCTLQFVHSVYIRYWPRDPPAA